jgi:hypothetical protein
MDKVQKTRNPEQKAYLNNKQAWKVFWFIFLYHDLSLYPTVQVIY